jgi:hypothetical protein
MTRRGRAATLGVGLALLGCKPTSASLPDSGPSAQLVSASAAPGLTVARVPSQTSAAAATNSTNLEPFLTERPLRSKSIGHTSVVLRVDFPGGARAAFKPRSRKGGERYRGEIAAYRLGFHLGVTEVPPCIARSFSAEELRASLGSDTEAWGQVIVKDGKVRGALVPWIGGLSFAPLEQDPMRTAWQAALFDGKDLAPADRPRMRQVSRMLVFDTVTGNWDRFSGGNVGLSKDGSLLFIDNDGAFLDPFPRDAFKQQDAYSKRLVVFPQGLMQRLRDLDDATLARVLGDDEEGTPLLSADVRKDVLLRARALIARMDGLSAADAARALP